VLSERDKKEPALHEIKKGKQDGSCVKCIIKEVKELVKKQRSQDYSRDTKRKKNGFKYKAIIWIYPREGGDDKSFIIYYREKPSKRKVEKFARKKGSVITTDFKIKKL
jgi:hypothetical protein